MKNSILKAAALFVLLVAISIWMLGVVMSIVVNASIPIVAMILLSGGDVLVVFLAWWLLLPMIIKLGKKIFST